MLHQRLRGTNKLNTKKIVFEYVFLTLDPVSLQRLRELSESRRSIEESINKASSVSDANAKDTYGGLTSHSQQIIQKLELYLPSLENLIVSVDSLETAVPAMHELISKLKIRWTSSMTTSTILPKYFQIDKMHFELAMTLFLFGAVLRDRAFEVLADDLTQSCNFLRRSAGVYSYLASAILPPLLPKLPADKPPEVFAATCTAWSLICLAEAQSVTIKKAEENKSSPGLLSKLHAGIAKMLDEASEALEPKSGRSKDISSHFLDYISTSRSLHELQSFKRMAQDANLADQLGLSLGLLRKALKDAEKKVPKDQSRRHLFKQEVDSVSKMLKKYEEENAFSWRQKVMPEHELPTPEPLKVVNPIAYERKKSKTPLGLFLLRSS